MSHQKFRELAANASQSVIPRLSQANKIKRELFSSHAYNTFIYSAI